MAVEGDAVKNVGSDPLQDARWANIKWTVYRGVAYDITDFVNKHPGGEALAGCRGRAVGGKSLFTPEARMSLLIAHHRLPPGHFGTWTLLDGADRELPPGGSAGGAVARRRLGREIALHAPPAPASPWRRRCNVPCLPARARSATRSWRPASRACQCSRTSLWMQCRGGGAAQPAQQLGAPVPTPPVPPLARRLPARQLAGSQGSVSRLAVVQAGAWQQGRRQTPPQANPATTPTTPPRPLPRVGLTGRSPYPNDSEVYVTLRKRVRKELFQGREARGAHKQGSDFQVG